MMKTTENTLQKIQEILDALVINERYYLITCIKKYNENSLTENEIFNLSIQPKKRIETKHKKNLRKNH